MRPEFETLLEDLDLKIRSKSADLKTIVNGIVLKMDYVRIDPGAHGGNGSNPVFQQLGELQSNGILLERLCEEIMTLLSIRKRILVHAEATEAETSVDYTLRKEISEIYRVPPVTSRI